MGFRGRWVNFAVIFPLLSMSSVYLQHRLTKCYLVSINCWSTVIYLKQLQYNSNWHATCTWVVPLSFLLLLCLPRPEAEMGYLVLSLLVFLSFPVWPALALHGRKKKNFRIREIQISNLKGKKQIQVIAHSSQVVKARCWGTLWICSGPVFLTDVRAT